MRKRNPRRRSRITDPVRPVNRVIAPEQRTVTATRVNTIEYLVAETLSSASVAGGMESGKGVLTRGIVVVAVSRLMSAVCRAAALGMARRRAPFLCRPRPRDAWCLRRDREADRTRRAHPMSEMRIIAAGYRERTGDGP